MTLSDATQTVKGGVNLNDKALRLSYALELIFHHYPRTLGVIILGSPGIGKRTAVLEHAIEEAKRLGKEPIIVSELQQKAGSLDAYMKKLRDIYENPEKYYIISVIPFGATMPRDLMPVPRIVTITDEKGVPIAAINQPVLKPNLALLAIENIYGVLLIDNVLDIDDAVKRDFLLSVFERRAIGNVKLSPNVRVIGLGHLRSESVLTTHSVKSLLWSLIDKAMIVYVKEEPLESWYRWMEKETKGQWYKEIYAFLKRYPNYYNNWSLADPVLPRAPIPRSWSALAVKLYNMKDKIDELLKTEEGHRELIAIIAADVGTSAAVQLVTFLSKSIIAVEDVIKNPALLNTITQDMDLVFRFCVRSAQKLEALLKGGEENLSSYLKLLVDLMEKTSKDVGIFILEMLSDTALLKLKKFVDKGLASESPDINAILQKLQEATLIALFNRISLLFTCLP